MSRFPSPFRSSREAAEESLHTERRKHESLESELEAVRRQLAAVRSNLGGTPAAATPHAAASAWAAAAPTPYGAAAHTPSYSALARGLGSGAAREPGVESYYIARLRRVLGALEAQPSSFLQTRRFRAVRSCVVRLRKLLGPKADIHNLLDHPGVTIEEAFGAVLAVGVGSLCHALLPKRLLLRIRVLSPALEHDPVFQVCVAVASILFFVQHCVDVRVAAANRMPPFALALHSGRLNARSVRGASKALLRFLRSRSRIRTCGRGNCALDGLQRLEDGPRNPTGYSVVR